MKHIGLLLLCCFGSLALVQAKDGIQFFEGSLEEAQALAAKEGKLIFMDAYTTWCGPCKRMSREVFTAAEVGSFYNKHFINIKVDMEKGEGPRLAGRYRVSSYPSLFFLNEKGEVVHAAKGSRPVKEFIQLGHMALRKNDRSDEYAKLYEAGDRSPKLLYDYAYALNNSGKPATKIANAYLRTQKTFETEEALEFLFDFANEADSKAFELLIQHRKALQPYKTDQEIQEKVRDACDATVQKAVAYQTPELLNAAKDGMKQIDANFAKEYSLIADVAYAQGLEDWSAYASAADKYAKKYGKKNHKILHEYAFTLGGHTREKKLLQKAEQWVNQALQVQFEPTYLRTQSGILRKLGRDEEARKALRKAAEAEPLPLPQH